jgi:regulator of RNase E activity RraA
VNPGEIVEADHDGVVKNPVGDDTAAVLEKGGRSRNEIRLTMQFLQIPT